ncbi:MAG: hypothetical protein ONB17_03815 [candidate division KSB1 bacterium]|nr:hypothetical protein [candidate division KSB1 bacterium]MDZ7392866.1 hypothetical protein [candidate division KSB1 bacterium]
MDNLAVAIALLGAGVLGMGWFSWSARSPQAARFRPHTAESPSSQQRFKRYDVRTPGTATPKLVAFCRSSSAMFLREDRSNIYVTYVMHKEEPPQQGTCGGDIPRPE